MFRIFAVLFILVPIVEIGVFIQVGDQIGLSKTLIIVVLTAIIGINLLKQQGFVAWREIQLSMAQGKIPAVEMAAAAQLLFAGGLLLTPGFVTDGIGFLLMVPQVRQFFAEKMISRGSFQSHSTTQSFDGSPFQQSPKPDHLTGRVVDGEVVNDNDERS